MTSLDVGVRSRLQPAGVGVSVVCGYMCEVRWSGDGRRVLRIEGGRGGRGRDMRGGGGGWSDMSGGGLGVRGDRGGERGRRAEGDSW